MASAPPTPDLAAVGGALGRHASAAARSWRAAVTPLLGLSVVTMAIAFFERGYCISNGWEGPSQFWRACYSDLPSTYAAGGLASGLPGYLGSTPSGAGGGEVGQPVLSGSFLALLGGLVPDGGSVLVQSRWFFLLCTLAVVVLVAVTVWATAAARPRSPQLAAHIALTPVLVTASLISIDALAVALTGLAALAWARRRPELAGILLALALASRSYPLVVLLALALLCLRTGRAVVLARMVGPMLFTLLVVALPFAVSAPGRLTEAYAAWWAGPAGLGSPWLLPQLAGGSLPSVAVGGLAVVGMVVAVGAGAWLTLSARRRPSFAEVALVVLVIVLLTGKAYPVQAALWLVPLIALAGLRWRDHLPWAATEAIYFVAVWLYLGGETTPDRALPAGWYATFLVLRLLGLAWLGWRVWRRATAPLAPEGADVDEELAGDLAGRPDRLVVRVA